ncbi:MAG TPA: ATP-binding protein [Fibrobacteria bacterium]|nr:ATP-binding protein [Fibrobacteria bacterium]
MAAGADIRNSLGSDEAFYVPDSRFVPFFRTLSFRMGWVFSALAAFGLVDTLSVMLWPERHAHPWNALPHQPLPVLLSFLLAGVAVLGRAARWAQAACGALILSIGLFCSLHAPHAYCDLDTYAGWTVLLTGFAVLAGASRIPMVGYVRQLALFALFFLCGLALISRIYTTVPDGGSGFHLGWPTALMGFIAAHAMLFQRPEFGVMRLVSGDGFGCHIMRRLLPSVMILLAGLGWLLAEGEARAWYPESFGESLYAVLSITGFSGILLFTAASLNRLDKERREREKESSRSREQLQAILDHTSAIICMKGLDGRYLLVNDAFCRAAGKQPAECIGRTAVEIIPGPIGEMVARNYQEALRTRAPVEQVEIFPLPNGNRSYLTSNFPLLDNEGAPYAVCGIYTDIDDIRAQQKEIERLNASLREKTDRQEAANRELEAFSYSVSHDLRAPLRHIAGFGELLSQRSGAALDEKSRHYLGVIQTSVSRMGALIDDLLAFSRANQVGLAAQRVRTADMVGEIRSDLESMRKGPVVEWTIGELPDMRGDPAMLRQVWINLLSNAVKYSGKNPAPRIEVGFGPVPHPADAAGASEAFFVRDNGAGFDMRYADKLFGVFQRLHSAQEYEGTGIGLAMVRRILERHGGRIWANASPGAGATFYFVVPEADAPAAANPVPASALSPEGTSA